ncbi:cupredoxin domain-containing protein [Kitasatospora paranensis]|uniref:Cupredoxin domain-containing protein n=1 Tax=Kitasatospora paranensis TaxID=258053 RepID=A0ABW2G2Y2_9ACTN
MTTIRLRLAIGVALLALTAGACSSSSGGGAPATPAPVTSAQAASPSASSSAAAPSGAPSGSAAGSAAPSGSGSASTGALKITISNFKFGPDAATVHAGETVTVVNADTTAHTLTATDKSFDTGTIQPGATATFTVPSGTGDHPYICTIHPFMHGTLTVG